MPTTIMIFEITFIVNNWVVYVNESSQIQTKIIAVFYLFINFVE